jgi:hypothetical protein
VGTDLFEWKGKNFLIIVDYYSRFIEIAALNRTTSVEVIEWTKSIFARHGIPEVVISDNGPQFSSKEYMQFAEDYQFHHITTSPYFPQANGEVERAVGTIKRLLKKERDPYLALLAHRSSPLQNGYSPSELLMSRKLRTTIPISKELRRPHPPDLTEVKRKEEKVKENLKKNFDGRHKANELSRLDYRDVVWIPQQETEAVVTGEVAPRSYELITGRGSTIRRNRRDLIQLETSNEDSHGTDEVEKEPGEDENNRPRRSQRESKRTLRYDPSWT